MASSASDIAALLDRTRQNIATQVGMSAPSMTYSGMTDAQKGITTTQATPNMPQAYKPPASSSSGGSSPWQSYNPIGAATSPPSAYVASAGKYTSGAVPSMPQAYSGPSSIIGNTSSFGSDMNKGYQSIYDSVRANDPSRNQINTWSDKSGNVYDTTKMTAQQIFAMGLAKDNNPNASKILQGMGLDMNGNPTSPMPTYSFGGGGSNMPMSAPQASSNQSIPSAMNYPSMPSSVNAPPAYTKNANVDAMPIDQQLAYYRNNPAEAQQELARAQGIGGSAAQTWANQLQSVIPQSSQQSNVNMPQQQSMPKVSGQSGGVIPQAMGSAMNNPYGLPADQFASIQASANAQSAADIAAQSTIANQQKSALQTNFDRMKSQETDSRNLENFKNSQLLSPFNGFSDYAQGQIARERATTDRQGQQDLQTNLGSVDAKLSDYARGSAAQKQQIVSDMAKQLSDYQLKLADLQLRQDDQSLKAQSQQFDQQQEIKKQHIDLANFLTQQYGFTVYPTDDPMLSYAQVAGIPTTAAQKIALDAQQMSFDNAVKKALAENTINKSQADIMQQAQQLAISQQNANTSSSSASWAQDPNNPDNIYKNAQINNLNNPVPKKNDLESQYISGFESLTPAKRVEALKNEKAAIVKDIGTSGYNSLYNMYVDSNGDPK